MSLFKKTPLNQSYPHIKINWWNQGENQSYRKQKKMKVFLTTAVILSTFFSSTNAAFNKRAIKPMTLHSSILKFENVRQGPSFITGTAVFTSFADESEKKLSFKYIPAVVTSPYYDDLIYNTDDSLETKNGYIEFNDSDGKEVYRYIVTTDRYKKQWVWFSGEYDRMKEFVGEESVVLKMRFVIWVGDKLRKAGGNVMGYI